MSTSRVLFLAACFASSLESAGGMQRHEGATSVTAPLLSFANPAPPPPPSWRRTGSGIGHGCSVLRIRGGDLTGDSSQPAAASIPCILECEEIWGRGSRKKFVIQDWLAALGHDQGPGELVTAIGAAFDCSISMIQYADEDLGGAFVDLDRGSWESFKAQSVKRIRLRGTEGRGGAGAGAGRVDRGATWESSIDDGSREEEGEGEEHSDDGLEGENVRQLGKGGTSIRAYVLDASKLYDDEAGVEPPAEEGEEGGGGGVGGNMSIRARIRKMLELGLHQNTGEHEAARALANAMRLLTKHNIDKAEVMGGALKDEGELRGGLRVVQIEGKGERLLLGWMHALSHVICDHFSVLYYTVTGKRCPAQIVFYGIQTNAACAAYAFTAAFNRISALSSSYRVLRDDYERAVRRGTTSCPNLGAYSRVCRASYRAGLVSGLKAQEARRKAAEGGVYGAQGGGGGGGGGKGVVADCEDGDDAETKEEDADMGVFGDGGNRGGGGGGGGKGKGKGKGGGGKGRGENDDDDYDDDYDDGLFDEDFGPDSGWGIDGNGREIPKAKGGANGEGGGGGGATAEALVVHSKKVGESVLERKGIKLNKGKNYRLWGRECIKDAFADGEVDSHQIDVDRRGIKSRRRRGGGGKARRLEGR